MLFYIQTCICLYLDESLENFRSFDQFWSSSRKDSFIVVGISLGHGCGVFTLTHPAFASSLRVCCRLTENRQIRCC